jgi:hypothetical protein
MKDVVEIGSGAMIYTYIPSFVKISLATQKLIWGYIDTQIA